MLPALLACSDYAVNPEVDKAEPGDNCEDLAPVAEAVEVDAGCVNEPEVGSFDPVIEWQWSDNPFHPGYDDIMSTPAVASLTDDDGDGDIDGDDVPDVVFSTFSGGAYTSAGALVAISGDGSGTLWSALAPGGQDIYGSSSPAIGDLDGDGRPEVCAAGVSAAVVCLANDGSFRFAAGSETSYVGAPALADLDGDGDGEVILGRQVFDHTGATVWVGGGGLGYASMSFPTDLDGDGQMELIAGNTVYDTDGSVLWTAPSGDGIPAVGDFDLDGDAELVSVYGGSVSLLDDGVPVWSTAVPGGGSGGPPTVADFDGDGAPEVGVAAQAYYSVIDTDGAVLWSMPVSDYSSSVTGSSVFDFEADGAAEVVYADEHTLWVFDGATGTIKLQESGHASGTLYEYPLVVDVDGDGQTEIVVASNDYAYDGWNGITVFGDASASWAESRPVWNEFAYHITNVDDDASLPLAETRNWRSWNNFRAAGLELGPSHWLPDLEVRGETCDGDCALDEVQVWPVVRNLGLLDVASVGVRLVRDDDAVIWSGEALYVSSGAEVVLDPVVVNQKEWGGGLRVLVDPEGLVDECVEDDGAAALGPWPCD